MISYEPLWHTLKQREISLYRLIKDYEISNMTLDALRKNKAVTLNTLGYLCWILDCNLTDVVECQAESKLVKTEKEPEKEKKDTEIKKAFLPPESRAYLLPEISYDPLWATLKKKELSLYQFLQKYDISLSTLSALRNKQRITIHILDTICTALQCGIGDVMEFVWTFVWQQAEGSRGLS